MDDRCIPEVCKSNLPQLKRNAQVRFVSLQVLCSPSPVCTQCLWIPQHRGFLHTAIPCCRRKGGSAQRSSSSVEEAAASQHWMAWNEPGTGLRGQKLPKLDFHQRASMVKVLRWLWIFCVAPQRNGNIPWEHPCVSAPPKQDFTTPHVPDLQPEVISCSLGSPQTIPGGAALAHSHTVKEKQHQIAAHNVTRLLFFTHSSRLFENICDLDC